MDPSLPSAFLSYHMAPPSFRRPNPFGTTCHRATESDGTSSEVLLCCWDLQLSNGGLNKLLFFVSYSAFMLHYGNRHRHTIPHILLQRKVTSFPHFLLSKLALIISNKKGESSACVGISWRKGVPRIGKLMGEPVYIKKASSGMRRWLALQTWGMEFKSQNLGKKAVLGVKSNPRAGTVDWCSPASQLCWIFKFQVQKNQGRCSWRTQVILWPPHTSTCTNRCTPHMNKCTHTHTPFCNIKLSLIYLQGT